MVINISRGILKVIGVIKKINFALISCNIYYVQTSYFSNLKNAIVLLTKISWSQKVKKNF